MRKKIEQLFKVISLRLLFALLSFLLALYIFALLTHEVFFDEDHEVDNQVFLFLSSYKSEPLLAIMKLFTFFGKPHFLIPTYLFLIGIFIIFKKKQYAIETAIMGGSSTLLLFGLKFIFGRKRPDLPVLEDIGGYSYPSGHALLSFVFCSLLIYFTWNSKMKDAWKWTLSVLLVIFSLLIGISRIVLRVHYFTDVLAGFCLGYAWVILALWFQRRHIRRKNGKAVELNN